MRQAEMENLPLIIILGSLSPHNAQTPATRRLWAPILEKGQKSRVTWIPLFGKGFVKLGTVAPKLNKGKQNRVTAAMKVKINLNVKSRKIVKKRNTDKQNPEVPLARQ